MVAASARNLQLFGFTVPNRSSREAHYSRLVGQFQDVSVHFIESMPNLDDMQDKVGIVDAYLGTVFDEKSGILLVIFCVE